MPKGVFFAPAEIKMKYPEAVHAGIGLRIITYMKSTQTKTSGELWRLLRKYRGNVLIAGRAVLGLGGWTMTKVLLDLFLGPRSLSTYIDTSLDIPENIQAAVIVIMVVLLCLFMVFIHYIIYRGAEKEGTGKKTGILYLIIAFLFIAATGCGAAFTIVMPNEIEQETMASVSSLLFDLALVISCSDVLYSGIMCRRLRRQLGLGGGAE